MKNPSEFPESRVARFKAVFRYKTDCLVVTRDNNKNRTYHILVHTRENVHKCTTATYSRHEPHDKQGAAFVQEQASLFRGTTASTAFATLCRQLLAVAADLAAAACSGACGGDDEAHVAATGCTLRRQAERLAVEQEPEPGWSMRRRRHTCAAHVPLQRRPRRCRGSAGPIE